MANAMDLVPVPEKATLPYPKNLASLNTGSSFAVITDAVATLSDKEQEAALGLLSEDPTYDYALRSGRTRFIIALSEIQKLQKFSFLNKNAEGTVKISVANALWDPSDPKWERVQQTQFTAQPRITVKLGYCESKYVKIDFDIKRPGRVSAFGLFGHLEATAFQFEKKDEAAPDAPKEKPKGGGGAKPEFSKSYLNYDMASLYSSSRVSFVSSGGKKGDEDPNATLTQAPGDGYTFDEDDPSPTMIIDLGKTRGLHRTVFQMDASAGKMEVYLLKELPKELMPMPSQHSSLRPVSNEFLSASLLFFASQTRAPAVKKNKLPDSFFQQNPPAQVMETGSGKSVLALDFPLNGANYLMLRWVSATPGAKGIKPLVIHRVSAFGFLGGETWTVKFNPRLQVQGSPKEVKKAQKEMEHASALTSPTVSETPDFSRVISARQTKEVVVPVTTSVSP